MPKIAQNKAKHIYIIAGEASGDFLGAQLMKELKNQNDRIVFSGIGGDLMIAEGLESFFPMNELSLMGLSEVLPKIISILKRIKQTSDNIIKKPPDIVVTIDAPDFSFRVIKGVRKRMGKASNLPKFVHYVAPTVWAWRPKRAQKIAKFLDAQICLFDFEPPYFEREGLKAIAVGHPMMESGIIEAKALKIGEEEALKLGVFFGSRQGEIKRISPILIETVKKLVAEQSNIELIVPTLPHLKNQITALLSDIDAPVHVETDRAQKWSVFKACDAAIAVSGTVGLELAAANVPHVIAYKMNGLTAMIARRLIKTPYAHLVNIMSSQEIIPEFIQENCTSDKIACEVLSLLNDKARRNNQTKEFEAIRTRIGGKVAPSKAAAEFLLQL